MTNPRLEQIAKRQMGPNISLESPKPPRVLIGENYLLEKEYQFLKELAGQTGDSAEDAFCNENGGRTFKLEGGRITRLEFHYKGVRHIPESINNLDALRELIMMTGEISVLPKTFFQLKQLELLRLDCNNIYTIPEEIGGLTQLKQLYLNFTKLTTLPDGFGKLKRLENLQLNTNLLEEIPDVIGELAQLVQLYIPGNRITGIPPSMWQLRNLHVLDISSNPITRIPKGIQELESLKALYIHRTLIETLPRELALLPELEIIGAKLGIKVPKELTKKMVYY